MSSGQSSEKQPRLRLNLGCEGDREKGEEWINTDLYLGEGVKRLDASDLSEFEDESVDEIKAFEVIEHLTFDQCDRALHEWYRVLKNGGSVRIECPNILTIMKEFIVASEEERFRMHKCGVPLIMHIYGNQMGSTEPSLFGFGSLPRLAQTHKNGFTPERLVQLLKDVGFDDFERDDDDSFICRIIARKKNVARR